MTDETLLECCQSILDFLQEEVDSDTAILACVKLPHRVLFPTPKQKIMNKVLFRNGWGDQDNGDMTGFTEYLNNVFSMGYQMKNEKGYKNFFENQSRQFYKHILRNLKLKQLLNESV